MASNILEYAYMLILSWAIRRELYGEQIKDIAREIIPHCSTQFAAYILSSGILAPLFKNHNPTISKKIVTIVAIINCVLID